MMEQDRAGRIFFLKYLSQENVFVAAHVFFAAVMVTGQKWANIATVLLGVVYILHFKNTRQNRALLPFIVLSGVFFAAIVVVHWFTFPDVARGLHQAEKYLPVIVMPVLLSRMYVKPIDRNKLAWVLRAFAISVTALTLYCLGQGLYNLVFLPDSTGISNADQYNSVTSSWNYISYATLSGYAGLHPTYLSIFVSFSIFILVEKRDPRYRYATILVIVFLIGFLFLLSSRMSLIAFISTAMVYTFIKVRRNFRLFIGRYLLAGLLVVVAFVSMVSFNNLWQKRLSDFTVYRTDGGIDSWNAVNLRYAIWKCNLDIARENFLLGIGFESQIRDACYDKYSFYPTYGTELNAHSQYLEFLVAGGIGVCLLFFVYMGAFIRAAIQHRNKLFLILWILLLINFLTECVISRANGILFMTYFSSFFMFLLVATNSPADLTKQR